MTNDFEAHKRSFKEHISNLTLHKTNNIAALRSVIMEAVLAYRKKKKTSERRSQDMLAIMQIINKDSSPEEIIHLLVKYLSGNMAANNFLSLPQQHFFTTGLRDQSHLENLILIAIECYFENVLQPDAYTKNNEAQRKNALIACMRRGLIRLENCYSSHAIQIKAQLLQSAQKINSTINGACSDFLKTKQIQSLIQQLPYNSKKLLNSELENFEQHKVTFGEHYSDLTVEYTLKDYINFACDEYEQRKKIHGKSINEKRREAMRIMKLIADETGISEKEKYQKLYYFLKCHSVVILDKQAGVLVPRKVNFNRGNALESSLQELGLKCLKRFRKNAHNKSHTFKMKQWQADPSKPVNNIILALHGWNGHLGCWNTLGQHAMRRDSLMIAFDQRAHGIDSEYKSNRLQSSQLRIDFRKILKSIMRKYPNANIELVGYSMGASILVNELYHVSKIKRVKSVNCVSPAILSTMLNAFLNCSKFGKRSYNRKVFNTDIQENRNIWHSTTKSFWTFLSLIPFMSQTCECLGAHAKNLFGRMRDDLKINIFAGKSDVAVDISAIKLIKTVHARFNPDNQAKINFHINERGSHALVNAEHREYIASEILDNLSNSKYQSRNITPNRGVIV